MLRSDTKIQRGRIFTRTDNSQLLRVEFAFLQIRIEKRFLPIYLDNNKLFLHL